MTRKLVLVALAFVAFSHRQSLEPVVAGVRDAVETVAECANMRMAAAASIADIEGVAPREEPWSVRLGAGSVASMSYEPVRYCSQTVDGTVVTLGDGRRFDLPGRARLVTVTDGAAEFAVSS